MDFPNGTVEEFSANLIDDNLFAQCDNDEFVLQALDELLNHNSDTAELRGNY